MNNEKISKIMEVLTMLSQEEKVPSAKPENDVVTMLTVSECPEVIHGVSKGFIRRLVKEGKLPHKLKGRTILINKEDLLNYFRS